MDTPKNILKKLVDNFRDHSQVSAQAAENIRKTAEAARAASSKEKK